MLAAQALNVPLGIVTNALLTRSLGPELFGLFVLGGSIVKWFEIIAVRTLGRSGVRLIAHAEDWKTTASQILQIQVLLSTGATLLLLLTAPWIASLLSVPSFTPYLRIVALQIPFAALVRVQESALIGRKRFGGRAVIMATHGLLRLALVAALLSAGLSLAGALLAGVGAAAGQLVIARFLIHVPVRVHRSLPRQAIADYGVPLFFYTIAISLYQNLDVILVKALSTDASATGFYGAAKSLMTMPGMISIAFSPLLLSVLTGLWQRGERSSVQSIITQTVRLHLLLLPFIALAAGTANEIIVFLYGSEFSPSAPIMAWLVFAGLASMLHSTMTASLAAIGAPKPTFWLTIPMLPLLIGGALIAVALVGPLGAAIASTILLAGGSTAAFTVLAHKSGARFPFASLGRMGIVGITAYLLGWISQAIWPTQSLLLIVKLLGLCLFVALLVFASREVRFTEIRSVFGVIRQTLRQVKHPFTQGDTYPDDAP